MNRRLIRLFCLALMLLLPVTMMAQNQSRLSGIIVDSDGNPMPGAVALVLSSGNGVVAGEDGSYSINGLKKETKFNSTA